MDGRVPMILWGLLLLLPHVHAAEPSGVIGDSCKSGQEFPVRVGPVVYLGCKEFAGATWCSRDDDSLELCPSLPIVEDYLETIGIISPTRKIKTSDGPKIVISEFMVINDDENIVDEDGETADWIELHNSSEEDLDLKGWTMTDDEDEPNKWTLPAVDMAPGDYILIVASGKDRVSDVAAHTNFKLSSNGEYLGIYRPDGSLSCGINGEYPRQTPNVPYGIAGFDGSEDLWNLEYTFLEESTPGDDNSGPQEVGPFVAGVHHTFDGGLLPDGLDLTITAVISERINAVEAATLVYKVMYGDEYEIPFDTEDGVIFTATIPASEYTAGDIIQYYILAVDSEGLESREPPYATEEWPEYHGTVVRDPDLESTDIPTLYWFTSNPDESTTQEGWSGSVFYEGRFYDNIYTRKRGVTALTWPKPKIKFDFKGTVFKMKKKMKSVEEFNLQSFWDEPGEDSYMRETVSFQVMREAGVPACESFHVRVIRNGEYYGLHAFVEQVDDTFLQKHGFNPSGPLFKSSHGELSNLRWDVKARDIPWAYKKGNRPGVDDTEALRNLIVSLGGGGDLSRSKFLYEHINLPEVINYMAISNMLLNQDRCTKNFYTHMDPVTERWSVLPWDLESAMGISNGLGGKPAPDYCILQCEQWNSPLYCDSQHPQDLIDVLNLRIQSGRRLAFVPRKQRTVTYKLPSKTAYDEDKTDFPSPSGADGTYNHMDDAILSWGQTREMYLRRLRTLMDEFLGGRLKEIIKEQWKQIKREAEIDNEVWGLSPNPIGYGYTQLLREQLPDRKKQLYDTYGPKGIGLIPDAQPKTFSINIATVKVDYVEVENPNEFAVDISGWRMSGGTSFPFAPGTVIPSEASVYVTPDIVAFRKRRKAPKGGMRLLILGPSSPIGDAPVMLINGNGQTIAET